jgi:hypothetical protein
MDEPEGTALSAGAHFKITPEIDYFGNDIAYDITSASAAECAEICEEISICRAFTWHSWGGCFPKTATGDAPTVVSGAISGIRISKPTYDSEPGKFGFTYIHDVDLTFGDLPGYEPLMGAKTADECAAYCVQAAPVCTHFTLTSWGGCYLKSAAYAAVNIDVGATSGCLVDCSAALSTANDVLTSSVALVADAPATDAPATDAPATDAPATDAPASNVAATAGFEQVGTTEFGCCRFDVFGEVKDTPNSITIDDVTDVEACKSMCLQSDECQAFEADSSMGCELHTQLAKVVTGYAKCTCMNKVVGSAGEVQNKEAQAPPAPAPPAPAPPAPAPPVPAAIAGFSAAGKSMDAPAAVGFVVLGNGCCRFDSAGSASEGPGGMQHFESVKSEVECEAMCADSQACQAYESHSKMGCELHSSKAVKSVKSGCDVCKNKI